MAEESTPLLTRDSIVNQAKLASAYITAFGGRVRVVELDATGRDRLSVFVSKLQAERGEGAMQECTTAVWLLFCVVDDSGNRLFADADLDAVRGLPGKDTRRVFKIIAKLNGLDVDDGDESGN